MIKSFKVVAAFIIVLAAFPLSASGQKLTKDNLDYCQLIGIIAKDMMTYRQSGGSIIPYIKDINSVENTVIPKAKLTEMVISAFEELKLYSKRSQDRAINSFTIEQETNCIQNKWR